MKIKGNILKARKVFVEERFGPDAWGRVLATLSEDDRKVLEGIIGHGAWYPFEIGMRVDRAIVDVLAGGKSSVFEDLGRASARENLTTVHRMLVEVQDPQAFMKRAGMIYRFYYGVGDRSYEATGPTSGVLTTIGADTFSAVDCLTVIGWYKEALVMCGAKNPRVVEESCRARGDETCRYQVSWE